MMQDCWVSSGRFHIFWAPFIAQVHVYIMLCHSADSNTVDFFQVSKNIKLFPAPDLAVIPEMLSTVSSYLIWLTLLGLQISA